MKLQDIGLIGLAVMGQNLVLNMERNGFGVAVYNRTESVATAFMEGRASGKNVRSAHTLKDLFASLKKPHVVNYNLALRDSPNGIDALVQVHEKYAGGATQVLYLDDNLYIMQRAGYADKPGLIYVLNNSGDDWRGAWVNTQWQNASFGPVAWWGKKDLSRPIDQSTDPGGRGQFFAPARGYAVYTLK